MRIIRGELKGKKIIFPNDKKTRPLRDMVKESIFNLLEHSNKIKLNISGADILDLFSGSGSFGLECISRGANKVLFIENYNETLKILEKNISNFQVLSKCKILKMDCFEYFNSKLSDDKKYEIIFLDPPFKETKINFLIDSIKQKKMLKKYGIIILHRHKNDNEQITKELNILDIRNYGISRIMIGN